jgi:uncharacterized membrane protein YqaE (UPF0057 family)
MRYLLAIVLPPIAVLMSGKPIQALLNLLLTILGIIPGVLHALFVVNNFYADRRTDKMIKAITHSKKS